MENEVARTDDYYEVDLIDLLAVILRYRKMIILGTLIITFLAGLFFYVRPKIMPKAQEKQLKVTYVIKVKQFPSTIGSGLGRLGVSFDINGELANSFEDYPTLAKEYKKYPLMKEDYPEDKLEYNKLIMDTFQNKVGKAQKDIGKDKKIIMSKRMGNAFYLECAVPAERFEAGALDSFIKEHLELINQQVQEQAQEYLVVLENKTMESYKEVTSASNKGSATTIGRADTEQSLRETLQDIEAYKKTPVTFYTLNDEPFAVEAEVKSKSKNLALTFFVSFFFFICLAFVNYIVGNIKNNAGIMQKISTAWKEGK